MEEPVEGTIVRQSLQNPTHTINREELEERIALEASRVTEAEDRLRDLTLHTEQQAYVISQEARQIEEHVQIRIALSHIARRKDDMLEIARAETVKKITGLEAEAATLTAELQAARTTLAEAKKVNSDTVTQLQEEITRLQLQLTATETQLCHESAASKQKEMASMQMDEHAQTIVRLNKELEISRLHFEGSQQTIELRTSELV